MWLHGVGQNRETEEEHDECCVEEGFQLTRVKFYRDGEGGREDLEMGYCSIKIFQYFYYLVIQIFYGV